VLSQAKKTLDRWYGILNDLDGSSSEISEGYAVWEALKDDLNTPQAIVELHALANQAYKAESISEKMKFAQQLKRSAGVLGVLQENPQEWSQQSPTVSLTEQEIDSFIQQRQQAREDRDFARADEIRQELLEKGIQLEDKAGQTFWRSV
jgi:cysteinyl-tRNA synthetase